MLDENPKLKKEYDGTMELVRILTSKQKIKIETLNELNSYSEKIHNAKEIRQIIREYSNLISEINNFSDYVSKTGMLDKYYTDNVNKFKDDQEKLDNMNSVEYNVQCLNQSTSINDVRKYSIYIKINYLNFIWNIYSERLAPNYDFDGDFRDFCKLIDVDTWKASRGQDLSKLSTTLMLFFRDEYLKFYLSNTSKIYIESGLYTYEFNNFASCLMKFAESEIILLLLRNRERYRFFLKWHKMLEENLPQEDKQLFYDYLTSCREKLQDEKDNYRIFNRQIRNLTVIVILGIIASAAVSIIDLPWLFWIGVILTTAVGCRLVHVSWKKRNKRELINCAIDVYDLDKIRSFKEPKTEKISTISMNENNKIEEINTSEQNDNLKSKPIDIKENINIK